MSKANILALAIGRSLSPAGFKRKGASWFFASSDTISVLNLQKSNYGPQYYVNVAIWLNQLGEATFPPEHKCHIRFRWEKLIPPDEKQLAGLLDLADTTRSDSDREAEICRVIDTWVLPFFVKLRSLKQLSALFNSSEWPSGGLVVIAARELLSGQ